MTSSSTPATDYSSRDYTALTSSMYDYAATLIPEWTSRSPSDFGVVFVELMAYIGDILSYTIDRAASEAFLGTAVQRSSVLAHAALMGYRPQSATPAQVSVSFTVPGNLTMTIPAGTLVSTEPDVNTAPVYFETQTALSFTAGGGATASATTTAIEGETVAGESIGVSAGTVNQAFALANQPVIESSVVLSIQDTVLTTARTWTFIDNLMEATSDAEVFTTDTTDSGQTLILFGNGVTGKVPPPGAAITASYRTGGGAYGNVSANTIVVLVSAVDNVLSLTNPTAGAGGADTESIDSIKANSPAVYRAQNRAVTLQDHADLALRVPGVAKAAALSSVYTNVTVFIAPSGGGTPTALLVANASNFIQARALIGVSVRCAAVSYLPVNVTASIMVYDQYNQESVRRAAVAALATLLSFDNLVFGQDISSGDVYHALMNVTGVKAATISVLSTTTTGVADITVPNWQIATAGAVQVGAAGGVVPGGPTVDIFGNLPNAPSATAAPTITSAQHIAGNLVLTVDWTPAANNTQWVVEVRYLDSGGATRSLTTTGAYTTHPQTGITVGYDAGATSVGVRTLAFNGATGPAYSPQTTTTNPT